MVTKIPEPDPHTALPIPQDDRQQHKQNATLH